MPSFRIDGKKIYSIQGSVINLDYEWMIECYSIHAYNPVTIRIARRDVSKDYLVSGELKISNSTDYLSDIWKQQVSLTMKYGESSVLIKSGFKMRNVSPYVFSCHLTITEISEKYDKGIENAEPRRDIQPMSLKKGEKFDKGIENAEPRRDIQPMSLKKEEKYDKGIENAEPRRDIQPMSLKKEEKKNPIKKIDQASLNKLLKDLERLLDTKTSFFADVILKCGGTSIPAHKNILSVRSPVFSAMFSSEMKEKQENKVDITDIDESTLRALLTFIYTGGTTDLNPTSAADLIFAADKYQVEDLKRKCCKFLKDNVSLQNVLQILVVGDMLDEDLKSFAVDYICNKCAEFSVLEKTEEWLALQKDRPALAMSILTTMVKVMNEKRRN